MGSIQAAAILAKVDKIILDETNVRWPIAELLGWLNSAQREIVIQKPNSLTRNESVQTAAGTKQSIPAGGLVLIDVIRNMGPDGSTPGRAIKSIDRDVLDTIIPDWHAGSPEAGAKHYVYDVRDPKTFYLYPPQASGQRIEIAYSVAPEDLTEDTQTISVDDIYEGCLIDLILYRAYSKDADYAGNGQRAVSHYQAAMTSLGVKLKGEAGFAPKMAFTKQTQAQE